VIPLAFLPFPFDREYMQHALVASLAVGVFAPMIGIFVVQKRMSLIGDGIGHLAFAGVGAAIVAGIWPVWGALVVAVLGALGIEWLRFRRAASGDLALALFFYSGIAAGVVLVGLGGGLDASLFAYLFGQPLTVDATEIAVIVGLGIAIVATVMSLRRALFAVVTDEEWSQVVGLPVRGLNALLAVMIAVAVVAAMRIVGVLLIAAMMVLPVASGQLLGRSFGGAMRWSVGVGVVSVVVGLALSRIWGLVAGGTMVLVAAAIFAAIAIVRRGTVLRLRAGRAEA
jgi:zinc transport system permease protein